MRPLFDKEAFFRDEYSHETPNILAGRIMVNICADGDLEAKEHVAFFVANPERPLHEMPFAAD